MTPPKTALGRRRLRLLRLLARAEGGPLPTALLAKRMSLSLETTRDHLAVLDHLGLARRVNRIAWRAVVPVSKTLDATVLDGHFYGDPTCNS